MTLSERLIKEGIVVIDRNNARRASSNAIFLQAGLNALRERSTVNDLLVTIDLTRESAEKLAV